MIMAPKVVKASGISASPMLLQGLIGIGALLSSFAAYMFVKGVSSLTKPKTKVKNAEGVAGIEKKFTEEKAKLAALKKLEVGIIDRIAEFEKGKVQEWDAMLNRHQTELLELETKYAVARQQLEAQAVSQTELATAEKAKELANLVGEQTNAVRLKQMEPTQLGHANTIKEMTTGHKQAYSKKETELNGKIERVKEENEEKIKQLNQSLEAVKAKLVQKHKIEKAHLETTLKIQGTYMDEEHNVQRAELTKEGNTQEARKAATAKRTEALGKENVNYDEALAQLKYQDTLDAGMALIADVTKDAGVGAPGGGGFSVLAALAAIAAGVGTVVYGYTHQEEVAEKFNSLMGEHEDTTIQKKAA